MRRKTKKLKLITIGSSSGDYLAPLCPKHDTIMQLVLKRDKTIWWRCGTLDCRVKERLK